MNLKEIRWVGVDEIAWFSVGRIESWRQDENEPYSSVKWDKFLVYLMNCQASQEGIYSTELVTWLVRGLRFYAFSCLSKNRKTGQV